DVFDTLSVYVMSGLGGTSCGTRTTSCTTGVGGRGGSPRATGPAGRAYWAGSTPGSPGSWAGSPAARKSTPAAASPAFRRRVVMAETFLPAAGYVSRPRPPSGRVREGRGNTIPRG